MHRRKGRLWPIFALVSLAAQAICGAANAQDVVISEIMYHPSSENDNEEYIELYNRGTSPADLAGWKITRGISFDFPDITLGPGEYLVVASDVATFKAKYPSVTRVIGNFRGKLSNRGETVELVDAAGNTVDRVPYADEGDWAVREEGPLDHGHRGWVWSDEHDGGGRSLELINPALPNEYGQNWAASLVDQGTPGAPNSVAQGDIAPLIVDVVRVPILPQSGEPCTVTARIIDESPASVVATLHHRVDGAPSFAALPMLDDGLHGDGAAGDGIYGAVLPGRADGTVVEYYIEASDGARSRTFPAPALVGGTPQQVTNLLYLVSDASLTSVVVAQGSVWRYLDDGSSQGTAWRAPGFDDSAWQSGPAQLGYGEGDEATVVSYGPDSHNKYITTYFRHSFNVSGTSEIIGLTVKLLRDDGAVVYLNGHEVVRDNMPSGTITYLTHASSNVGGGDEDTFFGFDIDPSFLVEGTNVLAVEIHQESAQSSDLSFDLALEARLRVSANDRWTTGMQPIYHLIMTDAERAELADIGDGGGGEEDSNAQMNGTFISIDEEGIQVRYNVGIRNRGHGSRLGPPNNYRVNFCHDRPWKGVTALNINCRYPYLQLMGSVIHHLVGDAAADARIVRLRVNGENLAESGVRMYGAYVALEVLDKDFAQNHFPGDSAGNLYVCHDNDAGGEADLAFEGYDPDAYRDTYFKKTNEEEDDWSDLIHLTDVLNNTPAERYFETVGKVVNVDQWVRYLALDALLGNREGGLNTGVGDDYALYRGKKDPRFVLIPYDLDTLLGQGDHSPIVDQDIFTFKDVAGLDRFLSDPEIVQRYYRAFFDLADTIYNPDVLGPWFDEMLGGWIPQSRIDEMKQFVVARTAAALAQIPQTFSIHCDLPTVGGYHRTTVPFAALDGTAHAAFTRSVLVNGCLADWSPIDGTWAIGQGGGVQTVTIVGRGSVWRYLDDGSSQGAAWRAPGFDDSAWQSGPAQLGYGDGDEATVVSYGPDPNNKYITTYFRHSFTIADASQFTHLALRLLRDDGAVVYLNGTEVARDNMPAGAVNYQTTALSAVGGSDEDRFFEFTVSPSLLVDGPNVLAVEIHQSSGHSSDISFDLELVGETSTSGPTSGVPLRPGINRVIVQAFDGPNGTGREIDRGFVDIWYDGVGAVEAKRLALATRSSYLPGVPILVRVEALDENGRIDREVWNSTATLSADRPDIVLYPNQVKLYNGLGSALVTVTGNGGFTLTARLGPLSASRTLMSLEGLPMSEVSGTLAGTSTTWSGIVHLTGDVLVPAGHTLTVEHGTLVLVDGVPSGDTGTKIVVQGTIRSLGTAEDPVTFTAFDPSRAWGEIHHDNAAPSVYQYTNITLAGHSPAGGHTNTGPMVRPEDSTITFDHVNLTNAVGKVMQASGSDITFRDCHLARAIMGPEIAGTALLLERTWITEMFGPDDDDGIYVHSQLAGQRVLLQDSVIADGDDDALDTLGSDVTVEDCILRDFFDKGASVFGGETTLTRTLIVGNGVGVSAKEQGTGVSIVNIDHATIVGSDIGIQSHDKFGAPQARNIYYVENSIIWNHTDAVQTDYDPADIHIDYSDVGESWPGTGNLNEDPLFAAPAANDYHLLVGSPCIDAGDPASPLDPDGTRTDMGFYPFAGDIGTSLTGTLQTDTILRAHTGPYYVGGDLVVPIGVTLTIEPGTTLLFYPGARVLVYGRLVAEGTPYEQIRFTRVPGSGGTWGGIQFLNTMEDNRIAYAVVEYGVTNNGLVHVENSNLLLDHVTFDHTDRRRLWIANSSLIVRNCLFTDIFGPGQPPSTNNLSEQIWGTGIAPGGQLIIENNIFGTTKGHNDAIDFAGGQRPGPIPQILNNVFMGGGDDALDLEADAHIEGNVFMNFHKDRWNTAPGESNTISAGGGRHYVVVRNIFADVDHVALVKNDSFVTFENNTVASATLSGLYFNLPAEGTTPGRGAYVDGCIFYDTPLIFDALFSTTTLAVNRSIVTSDLLGLGSGNTDLDPMFADPAGGDFSLLPGSPAIATGPNGLDMGALVPAGASISGEPPRFTNQRSATLTIAGPGITHYRFSLDGGPYGPETSVTVPIQLAGLSDGDHTVFVIGKNSAGAWQAETDATRSKTWTVNPTGGGLTVSEVMYNPLGGGDYEFIELHNASSTSSINLGDMSFTNGISYTFPAGAAIEPGGYVVVATGDPTDDFAKFRNHYGLDESVAIFGPFAGRLSDAGEQVTLKDPLGQTVVAFEYNDGRGWPLPADGAGHSLVPRDTTVQPPGTLDYGGNWRFSTFRGGSPGAADPVVTPTVVLNEVMAHTDLNDPNHPGYDSNDWIELHNLSDVPINLAGWYLSDDEDELRKWPIFSTATIPAHGFISFDEITGFHNPLTQGFGLSKSGERVFLSYLPGTAEDRVVDAVRFKGQESGVSLGRYRDGETYWYAASPTRGTPNAFPNKRIVINEIMYHPADDTTASEYLEIYNPTAQPVELWNSTGSWRLTGGVDFTFPPGTTIPAGGYLLLVNFDPTDPAALAAFKAAYALNDIAAQVLGPYDGNLSNRGERVAIEKPQSPEVQGEAISWVIVDEVIYFDRSPWTPQADGLGPSLHRVSTDFSGNDPANWIAALPSPGNGGPGTGYILTVAAAHGSVEKTPSQILYELGTTVTLTATPDPGYRFAEWSGDVPAGHETDNPLVLTMDADKAVTANFVPEQSATRASPSWVYYR